MAHSADDSSKKCKLFVPYYLILPDKLPYKSGHIRIQISTAKPQPRYAIVDYGRGNFSISQSSTYNTSNHIPQVIAISDGSQPLHSTIAIIGTGIILFLILIFVVGFFAYRAIKKHCAKPKKERSKKLDQIWVQIHIVESEGGEDGVREETDEGEEEVRLLTSQG